jgi:hypothetical protein
MHITSKKSISRVPLTLSLSPRRGEGTGLEFLDSKKVSAIPACRQAGMPTLLQANENLRKASVAYIKPTMDFWAKERTLAGKIPI